MSMSTHIIGLRDRESTHHKSMVAVLEACLDAGVSLPEEAEEYFGDAVRGVDRKRWLDYAESPLEVEIPSTHSTDDSSDIFEVRVDQIPAGVKTVVFKNSY